MGTIPLPVELDGGLHCSVNADNLTLYRTHDSSLYTTDTDTDEDWPAQDADALMLSLGSSSSSSLDLTSNSSSPISAKLANVIKTAREHTEEYQTLLEKSGHARDKGTEKELVRFIDIAKGHQYSIDAKTSRLNLEQFGIHLLSEAIDRVTENHNIQS